jgi:hypothetical protein
MALKPTMQQNVRQAIQHAVKGKTLNDYKIVWDQLQRIATPEIEKLLRKTFPGCTITITRSKSTYPDLKMEYQGFLFAFDIKSNESSKDPWYDIARLDTIEDARLKVYSEEFDLVIKYESKTGALLDIYFAFMRHTVGFMSRCDGVKFRPYDGKLRPKSWADFDAGKVYWNTEDDFLVGIRNARIYRWKLLIKEVLVKMLSKEEKDEFRKLFE